MPGEWFIGPLTTTTAHLQQLRADSLPPPAGFSLLLQLNTPQQKLQYSVPMHIIAVKDLVMSGLGHTFSSFTCKWGKNNAVA